MPRRQIFSVGRITQIRRRIVDTLSAIADATSGAQDPAQDPAIPDRGKPKMFTHSLDLSPALEHTRGLRLKTGYRLEGSLFRDGHGNGNGFPWAVKPGDAEPSHHIVMMPRPDMLWPLPAPKPKGACPDVMEAITGEFSPFSYLQASILKRELEEFGALWHGCYWSTYTILATPEDHTSDDRRDRSPISWRWVDSKIDDLRPRIEIEADRVRVTFHARSDLGDQRITRFEDTFKPASYRVESTQTDIAHGGEGYVF